MAVVRALLLFTVAGFTGAVPGPKENVEALLNADREAGKLSAAREYLAGVMPIFSDSVTMPVPGGKFLRGTTELRNYYAADTAWAHAHLKWAPVRGGISADGLHGFTLGYATLSSPDGKTREQKYLAYWIKESAGWRVAVYKRINRSAGSLPMELMTPTLPPRSVEPVATPAVLARYRSSLDSVERAFSDAGQQVGLQAAFVRFGSPQAANIGGAATPGFTFGADAIARMVGAGDPPGPASVIWAPDRVLAASSGDLGVTIGMIRPATPAPAGAAVAGFAYFTIWSRETPTSAWLYIAE